MHMPLEHPFGVRKKRMLAQLSKREVSSSLHVLFPEICMVTQSERAAELKTVVAQHLVDGDRSEEVIAKARQELEELGVWETEDGETAFVIEEMGNREKAAAFLAHHYYREAMFEWFWKMHPFLPVDAGYLHQFALDVACFGGKSAEEMKRLFQICLDHADGAATRQRLWNKLGVLFAYRFEFAEAEEALEVSRALLAQIGTREEQACRLAELHNGTALVFYKRGECDAAMEELERAERALEQCERTYSRAGGIRKLLEGNRLKLLQREAGGVGG